MFTGIPTIADLQCTVNLLMTKSLRENTRKTYTSAQNRYIHFCQLYGQTPMPATEQVLLLYIAYLYDQKLSHSTVHVYLAAVRSLHIFHGYNNPLEGKLMLKQAVKAVHIERGQSNQKLPITYTILKRMYHVVLSFQDGHVLWAAMTLAFFGCFRAAEITVNTEFELTKHLSVSSVSFSDDSDLPYMVVTIMHSKTDTYNKGVHVYIGCTNVKHMCPHCLIKYIIAGKPLNAPLFTMSTGSPLSKYIFVNNTKLALSLLGYDHTKYSGHSYRSGSATSAALAGMSDYEIKLLGRWSSDVYHRYIRTPVSLLTSFANRIVTLNN